MCERQVAAVTALEVLIGQAAQRLSEGVVAAPQLSQLLKQLDCLLPTEG